MIQIKKPILVLSIITVLGVLAIAQSGNPDMITGMTGYKMTKSYHSGFVLGFVVLKLIGVALVSLIFSLIFWKTYKSVMKKK